jgi:hypothetical protein
MPVIYEIYKSVLYGICSLGTGKGKEGKEFNKVPKPAGVEELLLVSPEHGRVTAG